MNHCPHCLHELPSNEAIFCPFCGTKQMHGSNNQTGTESTNTHRSSSSIGRATETGASSIQSTPVTPTNVTPSSINATPIQPTSVSSTPIQPTPIEPTSIHSTPIQPTSVNATPIHPTAVKAAKNAVFSLKKVITSMIMSLLGFIGMAVFFRARGLDTLWMNALLLGIFGLFGLIGIIGEIMKLPLSPDFISALNAKLPAGKTPVDPNHLNRFQRIYFRLQAASGNTRLVPTVAVMASLLTGVISTGTVVLGDSVSLFNTSITGRWAHDLNDNFPGESIWVTNITMWQLDGSEDGTLYMNVDESGTFNLEYNGNPIIVGTWTKSGTEYQFLHHDPDGILMSLYENYRIRGNHLYMYGGTENYFVKV